ncbi:hypothetical protein [Thalassotalea piscium]|uniref:Heme/copper-type cytochrome/quinol oxidase subunit 2 n=1 Tax=Thalassotalea piscium TaxID=1230533 RepID=A0A7X0TS18_9GAMM|nr:hypothetical protein [Thalassotalea piscium]MBB6541682.1 heme/copper-type cytochrome/quinol oxidase subunit 2 [Thalassotalea piscium]
MHLSVIIFAMMVAVFSSLLLCKVRYKNRAMTLKQAYIKHEMLFELTVIFGTFAGILIDLLIGDSLAVKLVADTLIIPLLAFVFMRPFLNMNE